MIDWVSCAIYLKLMIASHPSALFSTVNLPAPLQPDPNRLDQVPWAGENSGNGG
jgi:hypothetical protein